MLDREEKADQIFFPEIRLITRIVLIYISALPWLCMPRDVHRNFHFLVYRQLFTFALLKTTRLPRSLFLTIVLLNLYLIFNLRRV